MSSIEKHCIRFFDLIHARSLLRLKIFLLVVFVLLFVILDCSDLASQPALLFFSFPFAATISFLLF